MKERLEKAEEEKNEKSEIIKVIDGQLIAAENILKIKEEELTNRLNEEQAKGQKNNELLENIHGELDISHKNEVEMSEQCIEIEEKLEGIKNEILKVKENKSELDAQANHLSEKLKNSLPCDKIFPFLCEKCRQRVISDSKNANKEAKIDS